VFTVDGSAAGKRCWVTETACWKGSVPQIRVVVFVAMVGIRLGDSGGDGTLKSRPHTTPNGHFFGSAAGHPAAGGGAVEVGDVDVGDVEVDDVDKVGDVEVGEVGELGASRAIPCGVPIPRVNDAAHKIATLAARTDLGCRSGRRLSRIRRMRITPKVVRCQFSKETWHFTRATVCATPALLGYLQRPAIRRGAVAIRRNPSCLVFAL
jgi:hypothetical protein